MPKPRQFRTQAIILRRRDFGESDRLLTLFTPARGKLRAIAKGARKPSAKVSGHVELFTRGDFVIHRGRNLGIVAQAELVEPYLGLRDDLGRGAIANYAAELLDRFTADEEDESEALFALLSAALGWIALADDPRLAARFFELRLLDLAGFRPELGECVLTREPLLPEAQYFSFEEGGVVSRAAATPASRLAEIDFDTLRLLRHLQRSRDFQPLERLRLTDRQHGRAEALLLGYITYLLERRLESVAFIQRLRASAGANP